MKIGVAQSKPIKGDILQNIEAHLRLIELAGDIGANLIVFPELSITGYEPELASGLAYSKQYLHADERRSTWSVSRRRKREWSGRRRVGGVE